MPRPYGSGTYGSGLYIGTDFEQQMEAYAAFAFVIVEIDFPSGSRYFGGVSARFPGQFYEGRVLSIGRFRRAIQQNLGLFEVSSIDVEFADTDRTLIRLADTTRPKGSVARFKIGSQKLPLSDFVTFHEGKIDDFGAGDLSFRILVKDRLWTLPANPDTGTVTTENFPFALPAHVGLPLPVCYGSHSFTDSDFPTGTGSDELDYRLRGAWPTLYVDVRETERTFLIARHPIKEIQEVYAFVESSGSQLLVETTDYVAYNAATLAGETMAFVKLTTAGFGKITDSNGRFGVLSVNVEGRDNLGDGSGDLMTNPVDVLADLLSNYLGGPPINVTKFEEARVSARTRTYTTRGGYTEAKSTPEVLQEFANSFSMRIFPDTLGRISVDIFEPSKPISDVRKIRDQWEILEGSWSLSFASDIQGSEDTQVVNNCDYEFNYHHAKKFFANSDNFSNAASIANYGSKRLKLSLPWIGNTSGANDVAQRIVQQYANPVATARFKTALPGMLVDLTDPIDVTHPDGPISGGYEDRRFEITEHAFNPSDLSVEITAKDVDSLNSDAFFLDDEDRRERQSDGTASVTNADATITLSGATSMVTSGVAVGDHFELIDPTNVANRLRGVVAAPITATTFEAENSAGAPMTVWTNESGMDYRIIRSWLTKASGQELYGHLCDETTGQFSNGDEGFRLK